MAIFHCRDSKSQYPTASFAARVRVMRIHLSEKTSSYFLLIRSTRVFTENKKTNRTTVQEKRNKERETFHREQSKQTQQILNKISFVVITSNHIDRLCNSSKCSVVFQIEKEQQRRGTLTGSREMKLLDDNCTHYNHYIEMENLKS